MANRNLRGPTVRDLLLRQLRERTPFGAQNNAEPIRLLMLQVLRERVKDPAYLWEYTIGMPDESFVAGELLKNAGYLTEEGAITLAGIDYFERETANPITTWLKANYFPVFVAVLTAGATLGAGIITIWFGNNPC